MKFINNNLKTVGYINAVLIIFALVLRLVSFASIPTFGKVESIICIIALIFGLIYSLNGYKKDASKYYKAFMYLYLLSTVITLILSLFVAINELRKYGILVVIANVVILISETILAFAKDLGEKKSNGLALAILAISIFKLCFVTTKTISHISIAFDNLILAIILCVFVSAKYADKASRGAK